jgi:hypothetical protein
MEELAYPGTSAGEAESAGLLGGSPCEILRCLPTGSRPFLFTCDTSIMMVSKHHLKDCV